METLEFKVRLDAEDADAEELDDRTRELLSDLREQPVESAELVRASGGAPPGTKGIDPQTAEIAVVVASAAIKLVLDLLGKRGGMVSFDGRIGGKRVKFEGAAKQFAELLAKMGQSAAQK
jgi:hypothetical protein